MPRPSALVVDDIEICRIGTALMLESLGFAVELATTGREAIERFETTEYSVLILDYHMPDMSGADCGKYLRAIENGRDTRIPMIVLTASYDPIIREECMKSGIDDCLHKNCSKKELVLAIGKRLILSLPERLEPQ